MTFPELMNEAKKLKREESRAALDYYFEIVVARNDLGPVETLLQTCFGAPVKVKGQAPTPQILEQTRPYGGLKTNQTMYCRRGQAGEELAFLWPWNDGLFITVRIMTEKK